MTCFTPVSHPLFLENSRGVVSDSTGDNDGSFFSWRPGFLFGGNRSSADWNDGTVAYVNEPEYDYDIHQTQRRAILLSATGGSSDPEFDFIRLDASDAHYWVVLGNVPPYAVPEVLSQVQRFVHCRIVATRRGQSVYEIFVRFQDLIGVQEVLELDGHSIVVPVLQVRRPFASEWLASQMSTYNPPSYLARMNLARPDSSRLMRAVKQMGDWFFK
ncbi:unnamed protein product [Amoebophrya sp. A120]|nr:unnamed protein product [Amoebophrya sp. A120]|eukprot:GSA120T00018951001.1